MADKSRVACVTEQLKDKKEKPDGPQTRLKRFFRRAAIALDRFLASTPIACH
jgi:hypothetical protein